MTTEALYTYFKVQLILLSLTCLYRARIASALSSYTYKTKAKLRIDHVRSCSMTHLDISILINEPETPCAAKKFFIKVQYKYTRT
ncbi:hypothetical protein BDQ17DRAFT_340798 [Cyathus striatus]|nr:hypothetical protein BDQ17DRAFT_340798 [Cyathus striatus]